MVTRRTRKSSASGRLLTRLLAALISISGVAGMVRASDEDDYYKLVSLVTSRAATDSRSQAWKPAPRTWAGGQRVGGTRRGRLAVAIRKGELWSLDGVYEDPPENVTYRRFAAALHEPLGLQARRRPLHGPAPSELTRLRDADGDGTADEYLTAASGFGGSPATTTSTPTGRNPTATATCG